MTGFISIIHVVTCFLLVLVILIQQGKGAEISASFAGSSQTVFGSSGGANFFTRFTAGAAALFFITSLYLTINGTTQNRNSVFDRVAGNPGASAPVTPAAAPVAPATGAGAPAAAAKSQSK